MDTQVNTDQLIKSVQVFSTGSGAQHKEHRYGSRLPRMWWVLTSKSWIAIPINVYVLEHRNGLVLFDAGLSPAIMSNSNYIENPIVRFFKRKLFRLLSGGGLGSIYSGISPSWYIADTIGGTPIPILPIHL